MSTEADKDVGMEVADEEPRHKQKANGMVASEPSPSGGGSMEGSSHLSERLPMQDWHLLQLQ